MSFLVHSPYRCIAAYGVCCFNAGLRARNARRVASSTRFSGQSSQLVAMQVAIG